MRLLLVEDNRALSDWLARSLQKDNFVVDCCFDGEEADAALRDEDFALVILDLSLPTLGGLDVLKRLRSRGSFTPVLILTAADSIAARVKGLDEGADDYMAKPFDTSELAARIRALLRRKFNQQQPILSVGPLVFDPHTRQFSLREKSLALTPRERAVLEALALKAGRACSKAMLMHAVYSFDDEPNPNAVEIYVHRIRKKLEESGLTITTTRGVGYTLTACG